MKNKEARRAAFAKVQTLGEGVVIPDKPTKIIEADPAELEGLVNRGYLEATIGQLLEQVRHERGVGKRELARALKTSHGRITNLEKAHNLKMHSILEVASALGYDLEVSFVPQAGGRKVGALVRSK